MFLVHQPLWNSADRQKEGGGGGGEEEEEREIKGERGAKGRRGKRSKPSLKGVPLQTPLAILTDTVCEALTNTNTSIKMCRRAHA